MSPKLANPLHFPFESEHESEEFFRSSFSLSFWMDTLLLDLCVLYFIAAQYKSKRGRINRCKTGCAKSREGQVTSTLDSCGTAEPSDICVQPLSRGKEKSGIPSTVSCCHTTIRVHYIYRGADKSLARPGRKQATATEDFELHISYL
jgi:hypothetical protein